MQPEQVRDVERFIGVQLPTGYRQLLLRFSNGFGFEAVLDDGGFSTSWRFFGTDELMTNQKNRSAKLKRQCRLSWANIVGGEDCGHDIEVADEDGLLFVGNAGRNGYLFLALEGETTGMMVGYEDVWGSSNLQPIATFDGIFSRQKFSTFENYWADLRRCPTDTLFAIWTSMLM